MSQGEILITIASLLLAAMAQLTLWYRLASVASLGPAPAGRVAFSCAPIGVAIATLAALRAWASFDVREDPAYLTMYTAAGVAWVVGVMQLLHVTRLSWRDDLFERYSAAAGAAGAGLVAGATAAFVGGNVGDGPGWWVVLWASGSATLVWFAALEVVHRVTDLFEKVTLDLDLGAGLRLAGFALAAGMVAGRGAAGDWYSLERMVVEFQVAWPLVPLVLAAIGVERALGRTPLGAGRVALSMLVAAAYVAAAVVALQAAPPLTENPVYG